MFARHGLQELTGSRVSHRITAQRDRQMLGNTAASAKQRADGPTLTPSPPDLQVGVGGMGEGHREGQSEAWTEHRLLTAPCGNSIVQESAGSGAAETGSFSAHSHSHCAAVAWRGSSQAWTRLIGKICA